MVSESHNYNSSVNNHKQEYDNKMGQGQNPYEYYPPYHINSNNLPKVEAQEGMSYIMEKQQSQEPQLFEVPRFHMQHPAFFNP